MEEHGGRELFFCIPPKYPRAHPRRQVTGNRRCEISAGNRFRQRGGHSAYISWSRERMRSPCRILPQGFAAHGWPWREKRSVEPAACWFVKIRCD